MVSPLLADEREIRHNANPGQRRNRIQRTPQGYGFARGGRGTDRFGNIEGRRKRFWSDQSGARSMIRDLTAQAGTLFVLLASTLFAQNANPPGRLKVVIVEGDGAINNIRQHRAKEPVVQVLNQNSMPVDGASVTFLLPDSGPAGEFGGGVKMLAVVTNDQGMATGRGFTPNTTAGSFEIRVVASYMGEMADAVVHQTNAQQAEGGGSGFPKKYLLLGLIGGAVAAGVAIAAAGHGSSPASTAAGGAGIVISAGTPVFQPPH